MLFLITASFAEEKTPIKLLYCTTPAQEKELGYRIRIIKYDTVEFMIIERSSSTANGHISISTNVIKIFSGR